MDLNGMRAALRQAGRVGLMYVAVGHLLEAVFGAH
jgi:hypothetical protein